MITEKNPIIAIAYNKIDNVIEIYTSDQKYRIYKTKILAVRALLALHALGDITQQELLHWNEVVVLLDCPKIGIRNIFTEQVALEILSINYCFN